jgi:uncharacterized protein YkwD
MRKPLVVVCLAASAALLAGGIVATAAGADTTTDTPSVPGAAPADVPAIPDLPADPDPLGGKPVQPAADQPGAVVPGLELPGPGAAAAQEPAEPAQNQGQHDHDQDRDDQGRPQRPGGTGADPVLQKPAAQNPAAQNPAVQEPAAEKPAAQRPAKANVMAAAQQDVSPASVSDDVDAPVQRQVLALVNDNRRRGGCEALTLDRRLIAAANRHAADMARRGYFAHESPSGDRAGERVQDAGYRWSRYGENIARGQDSVAEVVDGWMHSPEHRENIMDCRLHQMGVGLAFSSDRTPYWVQDFATPQ